MGECIKFGRGVLKKTEILMIYDGGSALLNGTLGFGSIDSNLGVIVSNSDVENIMAMAIEGVDYTAYSKLCFEGYSYFASPNTHSYTIGLAEYTLPTLTFSDYATNISTNSLVIQYDFVGEVNIDGAPDGYVIGINNGYEGRMIYITKLWLEG